MAESSLRSFFNFVIRQQEQREDLIESHSNALKNHALEYGWEPELVDGIRIVDDGTGHRVAMDASLEEDIRNKNYGMPGIPHSAAITSFHYGLGGRS